MNRASAYLLGWATTPAPPHAGARAVLHLAEADTEVDDETGAATFRLGALDGTWATFFDRRLQLHRAAEKAVTKSWQAYAETCDPTRVRAVLTDHLGGTETLTRAAALAVLRSGHPDELAATAKVLAGQLRDARAEGTAGTRIIVATGATPPLRESTGPLDPDWTVEFQTAWDALAGADATGLFTDEATGWMARILTGASTDVGRALATVMEAGGGYDELLAAAQAELATGDATAVKVFVDQAVSLGLSQGALDLYSSEGITQVDFLTAGDHRVCARCLDAEQASPWNTNEAPKPGLHPGCRCVLLPRI